MIKGINWIFRTHNKYFIYLSFTVSYVDFEDVILSANLIKVNRHEESLAALDRALNQFLKILYLRAFMDYHFLSYVQKTATTF